MIKESCNLIGQENILVNHLKVYVIKRHLKTHKKTLFPLKIQLISHSELFISGKTNLRPTKFTPGKSRHAWA